MSETQVEILKGRVQILKYRIRYALPEQDTTKMQSQLKLTQRLIKELENENSSQ